MCSIFGILDLKTDPVELRKQALECSRLMRHRGPDWSGVYAGEKAILVHERLSIVDVNTGAQPLYNAAHTHVLALNGEIYNHQLIREQLVDRYAFQTGSDCEVILALYQEKGPEFLDELRGMFAFILYDTEKDAYLIGRDHMGIIPLYMGHDEHGNLYVASEMKALVSVCRTLQEFPLGLLPLEPGRRTAAVLSTRLVRLRSGERQRDRQSGVEGGAGRIGEKPSDVRCALRRTAVRRA